MPDEVVALIAQDGGQPDDGQEHVQGHAAGWVMGEDAGGEEQGVARQEGHEDHACLDEDDQEDEPVGRHQPHGDPARDGAARILEQVYQPVDEPHESRSIPSMCAFPEPRHTLTSWPWCPVLPGLIPCEDNTTHRCRTYRLSATVLSSVLLCEDRQEGSHN